SEELGRARTLFARAIETPGGLKIQTIHAFCASILRRFPLEAGVSPDFREMDQRLARLLQREVLETLAEEGAPGFAALAAEQTTDDIGSWLDEILRHKSALIQPKAAGDIWVGLGLPPGYGWADHGQACLLPSDDALLTTVARGLQGSGANDKRAAQKLAAIDTTQIKPETFAALEDVLVYGAATKNPFTPKARTLPTKAGRDLLGDDVTDALHALMERMAAASQNRRALMAAERSLALHAFAADFLPLYEARKAAGGWLDFDDLITKTQTLLSQGEMAAWVLYRLDGGIDHILVDEAQDTSPSQWDIIRLLSDEFLAGEGAQEDKGRTVFVVGDKKQSIYSFQGADPRAFDASQAHFADMLANADAPLQALSLDHSFRSSPAILSIVDRVFEQSNHRGLGHESRHIAFKDQLPGRVDVLTPHEGAEAEPAPWFQAVDQVTEEDPSRLLAEDVAKRIERMIGHEQIPQIGPSGRTDRPVEPRDILILVQSRSAIFDETIRACKARGIPLAGADQLNVAQELAVQDLTALLSFLVTPEDDLSLACVLKSPLFNWDERALFELAHHRMQAYLWPALRDRESEFPETVAVLQELLAQADFLRPFELIDRILTRGGGRRAIVARLGVEAEDAIDAFLAQALSYEQAEVPSLSGFLTWLGAEELKVKRAIDSTANVVRVMTVHGAKGLEAPIVILPDTAEKNPPRQPELLQTEDGPVWPPRAADLPDAMTLAREDRKTLSKEERQRLLYVAMTRAESWLIVGASGKAENPDKSWHAQISAALETFSCVPIDGGMRYEPLPWPAPAHNIEVAEADVPRPLDLPAPPPVAAQRILQPSQLGGAKTLGGTDEDPAALERGSKLHGLLETLPLLPADTWPEAAERAGASEQLATAAAIITKPELQHLFAPGTLAEVDVSAHLPEAPHARLRGSIDRLIVAEERVLAVDFKSNQRVPMAAADVPEGILRQMGAYASALSLIYPDKRVKTAILWTQTATLMELDHRSVIEALQRAALP
ncbi:MAG: double-strand break repair helicase AddA, partial [Pseudomonadota bacterium]